MSLPPPPALLGNCEAKAQEIKLNVEEEAKAGSQIAETENLSRDNPFIGTWSYRSFHNNPDLATGFNDLRFGVGTLKIEEPGLGRMTGTLGGEGRKLKLRGRMTYGDPFTVRFQGVGEIGGEEWVYDYHGFLSPLWPNGSNQRPAILGTIVRTVPHSEGRAEAGYVASWIAVKQE